MTARELATTADRIERRHDILDERRRKSLRHKGRIVKRAARQVVIAK